MPFVYKLSGNGLTYYGSCIQRPNERKLKHISDYRYYISNKNKRYLSASYKVFESYGDDWENGNWIFEVLRIFETKQEAREHENMLIITELCVNRNRALGKKEDEMRKYKAEWARNKARKEGIIPKKIFNTDEERKEANRESKRNYMRRKRARV
jgi:hypothetical protein